MEKKLLVAVLLRGNSLSPASSPCSALPAHLLAMLPGWGHALVATTALLLAFAAPSAAVTSMPEQQYEQQEQWQPLFSPTSLPHQRCAAEVPVAGLNLTAEEQELLQFICWPEAGEAAPGEGLLGAPVVALPRGVPAGVNCTVVPWCDGDICTEVCERGSVQLEAWLSHAIKQQTKLVQTLPLCYATLLGTHNSAISLADGYGNLDDYFQGFFKYIRWALHDFSGAPLHTNNQLLSLTDQLNLGVRSVELDTHWVGGVLRIAHCGGLHMPQLNKLIDALNFVAKLLHRHIRWDTETLGCVPSLSSIPSVEQRLLTDAMQEIKEWMVAPENADEFLILYFDDQLNLQTWVGAGRGASAVGGQAGRHRGDWRAKQRGPAGHSAATTAADSAAGHTSGSGRAAGGAASVSPAAAAPAPLSPTAAAACPFPRDGHAPGLPPRAARQHASRHATHAADDGAWRSAAPQHGCLRHDASTGGGSSSRAEAQARVGFSRAARSQGPAHHPAAGRARRRRWRQR